MADRKEPFGRPCKICTHPKNKEIEGVIEQRLLSGQIINFRNISENFGMSISSVSRHVSDHLKLELKKIIEERRTSRAVNVHEEFCEQLDFAKKLREQAETLVNSVDANDRRFAVDAIKVTDLCIDKFAKMGGDYTDNKLNPNNVSEVAYTARHERLRALRDAEVHAITSRCEHCSVHNLGAPLDEGEYERLLDGLASRYKVDKEQVRIAVDGAIQQELGQVG